MKKFILIFCFCLPFYVYSQDIKKFYHYDKKQINLIKLSDNELHITINQIKKPEGIFFNNELNKSLIKSYEIKGDLDKKNFLQKLFTKKKLYNYSINFSNLKDGFYLFQLEGKNYKQESFVIITRYKLITKLLYNQCSHYFINSASGKPVKKYTLYLLDKEKSSLSKKEDYFYNVLLEKKNYGFLASYSNCYDLNIINNDQVNNKETFYYIDIFLPKDYYYIGESLSFIGLLKIKKAWDYNNADIPFIEMSIYDNFNNLIKHKTVKNIDKGFVSGDFIIDDKFKEGTYIVQIKWNNHVKQKKITILEKYIPQLQFKIMTEKSLYYFKDKININIEVFYKYGQHLKYGNLKCDILYKKLDSEKTYKYLTTLIPKLQGGKIHLNIKLKKLLKQDNYFIKFIVRVRSNNGFEEADYHIIKIIKADFKLLIKEQYNLFEIEKPVILHYNLIPLISKAHIKKFNFNLYRICNLKTMESKFVFSKVLKIDKSNITFQLKKSGLYMGHFFMQDKMNRIIEKKIYFWVLSYTYGIDVKQKLDDIIIIQNKKNYDYSDIGKVLILFPDKNIWYNIYIEGEETFYNKIKFAEKNFILFDFPIYEKYSPGMFLKVTAFYKNTLFHKQVNINVPYVGKYLKIQSEISNIYNKDEFNKIKMETLNYWGHNIAGHLLFYNLNKNFQDLYNQRNEGHFLYSKLYEESKNPCQMTDFIKKGKKEKTSTIPYPAGFIYSDYLYESLNHYELFFLNKEEIKEKKFQYSKYGSWVSSLFGFTYDTKIGFEQKEHFYKRDYVINYYFPEYLSVRDKTYFFLLLQNKKNVSYKFKFNFTILNGKYKSQLTKYVSVKPFQRQELLLMVNPKYQSSIKIGLDNILPTTVDKKEFFIKLRKDPKITKQKNKFFKIKKYYYKLKYFFNNDIYYSKLKRPGWFLFHYNRGDDVVIRFKIKVKQYIENVKIIDFPPAGCEYIENQLKYHLYKIKPFSNYGIVYKEGKIIFHIPELEKGVYNIYYILKAKYAGKYFLPGYMVFSEGKSLVSYPEDDYVEIY